MTAPHPAPGVYRPHQHSGRRPDAPAPAGLLWHAFLAGLFLLFLARALVGREGQ